MQACTSLQTDNHASTPPLSLLQAGCPSCRPANSVKALKVLHRPYTWYGQKCDEAHAGVWFQRLRYAYACGHRVRRTLITDAGQILETNDIGSCANRNVRRILVRGVNAPLPPEAKIFGKFDYEMAHSEVYLNVVSIAPFSTPACLDCSADIT